MEQPGDRDRRSDPLQLAALGAAAIGSTMVARSGETNWLEGFQLLVVYFIVAVAFWLL